jgi:hypothetical protein
MHIGLRQATPGDRLELIWEQEAPGSNPGIPTTNAVQRIDTPIWRAREIQSVMDSTAGRRSWSTGQRTLLGLASPQMRTSPTLILLRQVACSLNRSFVC